MTTGYRTISTSLTTTINSRLVTISHTFTLSHRQNDAYVSVTTTTTNADTVALSIVLNDNYIAASDDSFEIVQTIETGCLNTTLSNSMVSLFP